MNTRQDVRQFYDRTGWSQDGDGLYQNAQYEDLRPVVRGYIHRCHLRVNRYLDPEGDLFLDAGSGPVQYPQYLTYSRGYRHRVCADLSITALMEARRRLGDHGLYVVMDIARLPFRENAFDGLVSLHTIHHLPPEDHRQAYAELYRVLKAGHRAVVVNGWSDPPLMRPFNRLAALLKRLSSRLQKRTAPPPAVAQAGSASVKNAPAGTFVHKSNADWLRAQLEELFPFQIFVWRSLSTKFTRTYIHPWLLGRLFLRLIYRLEEIFPRWLGENGQYPCITFTKELQDKERP